MAPDAGQLLHLLLKKQRCVLIMEKKNTWLYWLHWKMVYDICRACTLLFMGDLGDLLLWKNSWCLSAPGASIGSCGIKPVASETALLDHWLMRAWGRLGLYGNHLPLPFYPAHSSLFSLFHFSYQRTFLTSQDGAVEVMQWRLHWQGKLVLCTFGGSFHPR